MLNRERGTTIRMPLRKRWLDILAALGWALLASLRLAEFLRKPTPLLAGLLLINLIVVALFILRRPAASQGPRSAFWLAAFTVFLSWFAFRPAEAGFPKVGLVVQNIGLALMLLTIVFLNRSFGIAPAHRGLVTRGPYRLVRHPLYASEMVAFAGYCLGYASVWNGIVWSAILAAQLLRIRAEEGLLSKDVAYWAYQRRVPWRLVPGVW